MRARRLRNGLGALTALVAVGCFTPEVIPAGKSEEHARAVALYDAGNYAEAQPLLAELIAGGQADGPTLYRLYFCQREAGDSAARQTLLDARAALETELPNATGLDTAFYLANVYRNTARLSDAKRIAEEATAKVESGKLEKPKDGLPMFQLGKLYADQDREDEARRWYGRAIERFADSGETLPPSAQWAARYLGEQAYEDADWAGTDRNLGLLFSAGTATIQDLNRLAGARVRTGDYAGAAKAWFKAANLDPAQGDHPRYSARLAKQARELSTLPEKTPDGRSWQEASPADLETLMSERAGAARTALAEAPPQEEIDDARAREIEAGLAKDRAVFIRAGLEYAMRGLPIRETAFRGGYAPMIFHARQWKLPPRPHRRRP